MIIDRYLIREVVQPFWVICLTLVIIFVTFSLSRFLVSADAGLLQQGEIAHLTLLKSIISLEVLLPLSLYLALMTGLGRLYSDSEIYAMRASGISEAHLLRPVMRLTLLLAILISLLSTLVRPWAYTQAYAVTTAAAASAETGRIKEARFYTYAKSQRTVFIEHIAKNGKDLKGIFIRTRDGEGLQVITASVGAFRYFARPAYHRLELKDAHIFKKIANGTDFSAKFGSFTLWLPVETPQSPGYRAKATPIFDLFQSTDPADNAELQWRLSTPISALLLSLLAIPLSRSRPRKGRYAKMLLAIGIYAVYSNMLDISRNWVEQGNSHFIWWVPLCLGLLVAMFYWPVSTQSWRRKRAHD